jgi:hypothetical protein
VKSMALGGFREAGREASRKGWEGGKGGGGVESPRSNVQSPKSKAGPSEGACGSRKSDLKAWPFPLGRDPLQRKWEVMEFPAKTFCVLCASSRPFLPTLPILCVSHFPLFRQAPSRNNAVETTDQTENTDSQGTSGPIFRRNVVPFWWSEFAPTNRSASLSLCPSESSVVVIF